MRTSDPTTVQMLAYGLLLIREAQQHQGHGWMEYDRVFRQQAAIDQSKAWNILHADIQASMILGRNLVPYDGMYCTLCFESDHRADHCTLQYFAQPTQQAVRLPNNRRPETMLQICYSWNRATVPSPAGVLSDMCALHVSKIIWHVTAQQLQQTQSTKMIGHCHLVLLVLAVRTMYQKN